MYHGDCFNRYDAKECKAKWAAFVDFTSLIFASECDRWGEGSGLIRPRNWAFLLKDPKIGSNSR
jgi:hypothetical protein